MWRNARNKNAEHASVALTKTNEQLTYDPICNFAGMSSFRYTCLSVPKAAKAQGYAVIGHELQEGSQEKGGGWEKKTKFWARNALV